MLATLTTRTILQAPLIDDIINGPIRGVFLKHAAHRTLCLYLQHRHHTVDVDKAIVKVEGTAHLMDGQAMRNIVSFGNKIVPTTWMTSSGEVLPMEFAVVPAAYVVFLPHFLFTSDSPYLTRSTNPGPTPAFLSDFSSVLASNGCDGLFGIDTIASGNWSEMKIGGASVVVSNNGDDHNQDDDFIPVAFAFDEKKPQFTVHGKCKRDHKHTSKPHNE